MMAQGAPMFVDDEAWTAYQRALDAPAEIRPELVALFSEPDLFD